MTVVTELAPGLHCIDLEFQSMPGVIASYLLSGGGEYALIETGPTTTLGALTDGLEQLGVSLEQIGSLLVTHIHLDHAGAAGVLIDRYPDMQLYVHEVGAPHLIDPARLMVSATRIYGDRMDTLWGEVLPVPARNVHVLTDGDIVSVASRDLKTLYTPGHAWHHVAYHDDSSGDMFTGDVAGVRLQACDTIRPPTPPPDIDLDTWHESLQRIRDAQPSRLLLTHFGPHTDVSSHLDGTARRLDAWADVVGQEYAKGRARDHIVEDLSAFAGAEMATADAVEDASSSLRYELATPTYMSADGLIRYFRKRSALNPS
jgi:glyoxylase-like metal-dependent hydrolase (beta-lactamase superfamily II)